MKCSCSHFIWISIVCLALGSCQKSINSGPISKNGTVKITFRNMVGSNPMVLNAPSAYTNPFGEPYTITKFKYYVSNVQLGLSGPPIKAIEPNSYHLIDQAVPGSLSFSFEAAENKFVTLSFLIGVDSARNTSGAQTGALDPLNDMFWTWNSGYVMAKMEGTSPLSAQPNNLVEYHVGGFAGVNNVIKGIGLTFPSGKFVQIRQGQTSEITVEADFNTWWQNPNDIKIATTPVCTTPGVLAKKLADNYSKMFRVTDVVNN